MIPGWRMAFLQEKRRNKAAMEYAALYKEGSKQLKNAGITEAELDARLLLQEVCGTDRNDLLVHGNAEVQEEKEKQYRQMLCKRCGHIPLQHILGYQEFMGLRFQVNENVLIPRQDTEILVEEVMRELHAGMHILDLCTGSGCILLSLLRYSNDCQGTGSDLSEKALIVARENARRLSLEASFVQGDLFENITGRFEVIVSNPPYIRHSEIASLMEEVRKHDPMMALDGGEDGLAFYRRIIKEAGGYLYPGGKLFLEIGWDQAKEVSELLQQAGYLDILVSKDYAGHDRVVCGRWKG